MHILVYVYNDLFDIAKKLERELDYLKEELREQTMKANKYKNGEEYWKSQYKDSESARDRQRYSYENDINRIKEDASNKEYVLQKRIDARNEVLDGRGLSYQVDQYERRAESAEAQAHKAIENAKKKLKKRLLMLKLK